MSSGNIQLIIALLCFTSALHSSEEFNHFANYTTNIFANIGPLIAVTTYRFAKNDSLIENGVTRAGIIFFGSLTVSKLITTLKESKNKPRAYLFKTIINAWVDIVLILGSLVVLFDVDGSAEISGVCLVTYIIKYLIYNRPKKAVTKTEMDNTVQTTDTEKTAAQIIA